MSLFIRTILEKLVMTDPEDILDRVLNTKDFCRQVLSEDYSVDWLLVRDLGAYLIRVSPDLLVGYLIRARAYRHLGDRSSAGSDLEQCRGVSKNTPGTAEQALIPILEEEERLFAS